MGCFHSKHLEEPVVVEVIKAEPVYDSGDRDHHDRHVHNSLSHDDLEHDFRIGLDDDHIEPRDHIDHDHIDHDHVDRDRRHTRDDDDYGDDHSSYEQGSPDNYRDHRGREEYDTPEEPEEVVEAVIEPMEDAVEEIAKPIEDAKEEIERRMHHLVFPRCYERSRPSFYAAYARAARRYGFESGRYAGFCTRNKTVVKLTGRNRDIDHEVPAESIQNGTLEYVVPVKIGTPGITVYLDFDTGSSDLWIWSCELANVSKYFKSHHIYSPRKSETAKKQDGTWRISYGDGSSASGDVYSDTISVAGVTIPRQSVECARKLSSAFLADGGNDGLLGLAWPKLNTVEPHRVKTPMQNMIEQGVIDKPVFTVKLGGRGKSGFYSFGHIDYSVTSRRLHYTDVDNSQGLWEVDSQSYSVRGKIWERRRNTAILDTGTTLLLVDDRTLRHIYDEIEGSVYDDHEGGWKYPNDARIPEVSFAVGDYLFTIYEENFAFGPADDGYTLGGIQSRGDQEFDIFGDVFFKNVYVVFDQGNKTVGVAQRE